MKSKCRPEILTCNRINLPPLCERKEDIPALARHFLEKHTPTARAPLLLSPAAHEALVSCLWPGNVRELENAIIRGIHLCQTNLIEIGDLEILSSANTRPEVTLTIPSETLSFKAMKQKAMAYEPGDPAVIVAIVDTGVAMEHPELYNRLRPGFDTVELGMRDLANGLQLLGDRSEADTDPADEVGHGTSCAAIIGAAGERIPPGLAGASGLLPIRVLGAAQITGKSEPIGIGALADIDAGIKTAIDLGAQVINMSFGTPESALDEHDPAPHADVVRYGLARGCIMVAASGNSGKPERFSPAMLPGVIAVGAVNADGKVSAFSTTGEHVALCAPGERVVTAGLRDYQMVTGTSFAAPFVAATAALLVSRGRRRSHSVDTATVKRILVESVQPWSRGQSAGSGAGVLDAHAALRALDREIDRASQAGRNSNENVW